MSFYNMKILSGAAIALIACLAAAQPGFANHVSEQGKSTLLSQANVPEQEGTPALNTEEVRGRVTKMQGDRVEIRLASGELRTYTIPATDQERNNMRVGSDVTLTVRGDTVVAIAPATGGTATSGSMGSGSTGTMRSGQSSSSSSSTTIRRETTVQSQPAPRPAPAPAPAAQPAPQPVRGLW